MHRTKLQQNKEKTQFHRINNISFKPTAQPEWPTFCCCRCCLRYIHKWNGYKFTVPHQVDRRHHLVIKSTILLVGLSAAIVYVCYVHFAKLLNRNTSRNTNTNTHTSRKANTFQISEQEKTDQSK